MSIFHMHRTRCENALSKIIQEEGNDIVKVALIHTTRLIREKLRIDFHIAFYDKSKLQINTTILLSNFLCSSATFLFPASFHGTTTLELNRNNFLCINTPKDVYINVINPPDAETSKIITECAQEGLQMAINKTKHLKLVRIPR